MFENLTDKLQGALKRLRGQAIISESNIAESMADIREALLDADVNLAVAEEFVRDVTKECLGEEVLRSISPGQQAVKIVYDKLVEFMGAGEAALLSEAKPNIILMVGLHGSGKTTTSAKLALNLKKKGKKVLLAAADIYRPAAVDQLEILGKEIGVPVFSDRNATDVARLVSEARNQAETDKADYLIVDTAGRLQIDAPMIQELVRVRQVTDAGEILLVADAALGQQAVSVAEHFHKALTLTGLILTKLDGDARGGAALSIRKVTGCPVKFIGTGEKLEDLDVFHPDRMVSRILGMGDIVSLVEKASEQINREEAEKLEAKLKKNEFDFDDFLSQLRQMTRMGGIESIMKLLPGGHKLASMPEFDTRQFRNMEAIICSMNKQERANAEIIDLPRRRRIARGSGRPVEEVSQLVKQFLTMKKVMKNTGLVNRMLGGGGGPGGFAGLGAGMRQTGFSRGSNFTPPKKKRKKR